MAARFAKVTEEEIAKIIEDSIPEKTKQSTKYGLKIFQGKIVNFTYFYLEKNWLRRNATQSLVWDLSYVNKLFIMKNTKNLIE